MYCYFVMDTESFHSIKIRFWIFFLSTTTQLWFVVVIFGCCCCVSAWVDAVWDLEFTEKKPLDDVGEEEPAAGRDEAFRALYQCLLLHSPDQQHSADRDGASIVSAETAECPVWNEFKISFSTLTQCTNWLLGSMLNCRTCGRRWGRTGCPSSPWWLFCPPSSGRGKTKEPAFSREWAVCTQLPSTCCSWESPVRKMCLKCMFRTLARWRSHPEQCTCIFSREHRQQGFPWGSVGHMRWPDLSLLASGHREEAQEGWPEELPGWRQTLQTTAERPSWGQFCIWEVSSQWMRN